MNTDDSDGPGMAPNGKSGDCDRPTCNGVTADGTPCEDIVVLGLDVCHTHLEQSEHLGDRGDVAGDQDDRPVWERHAAGHRKRGETV